LGLTSGCSIDECLDEAPLDGPLELWWDDLPLVSTGGCGDRENRRDRREVCDGDLDGGNEDKDIRLLFVPLVPFVPVELVVESFVVGLNKPLLPVGPDSFVGGRARGLGGIASMSARDD
jgi:hypothetical protein